MSCANGCENCTSDLRNEVFNNFKDKYQAISSFRYSALQHSHPTTILLGLTNQCNLKCDYCFVKQNPQEMTLAIAEQSIEWLKKNNECTNTPMSINFFGGEPLLKFQDIIKPIVEKYHNEIAFGITTNGVLLNEDIVDFFYQYNVNILLSFDGVPEVQNKQRSNSFNQVLNNIPYLLVRFPKTVMRATVTKDSIPYLYETVQMAKELGFKKISFCPNAYETWDRECEEQLLEQFKKIGLLIYKDLRNNTYPIEIDPISKFYNNTNLALKEKIYFNNRINRCGLGTTTCAICPNGDIVPCQEKISNPTTIIGNIYTGIDEKIHKQFLIDYFNNINNLTCDKGCDQKAKINCLADICPSRFEDLNYNFSSASCAFIRIATQVANRLHFLCNGSSNLLIRSYFGEA